MQEIDEKIISKILSRIFRDTLVMKSGNYFITHTYNANQFGSLINPEIFHNIIGFLPNTKYKGKQFIMSVVFNKKRNTYEITVKNPNKQ